MDSVGILLTVPDTLITSQWLSGLFKSPSHSFNTQTRASLQLYLQEGPTLYSMHFAANNCMPKMSTMTHHTVGVGSIENVGRTIQWGQGVLQWRSFPVFWCRLQVISYFYLTWEKWHFVISSRGSGWPQITFEDNKNHSVYLNFILYLCAILISVKWIS